MKIIAIVNQKGGVGKTTTSINLSSCLADFGKKVLLVDMDPQGNTTQGIGFNPTENTIYECLIDGISINTALFETVIENLNIVPANIKLANAELELAAAIGRESILKECIDSLESQFDFIIIDCTPSLGLLTLNALVACNSVIIPLEPSIFALEGINQLLKVIQLIRRKLNSSIHIKGVLLTRVDSRTNIAKDFLDQLKELFSDLVFKTVIHQNVSISEAQAESIPISKYDLKSKGAKEYLQLAKELIERE